MKLDIEVGSRSYTAMDWKLRYLYKEQLETKYKILLSQRRDHQTYFLKISLWVSHGDQIGVGREE